MHYHVDARSCPSARRPPSARCGEPTSSVFQSPPPVRSAPLAFIRSTGLATAGESGKGGGEGGEGGGEGGAGGEGGEGGSEGGAGLHRKQRWSKACSSTLINGRM